jgi:hypothetical protein
MGVVVLVLMVLGFCYLTAGEKPKMNPGGEQERTIRTQSSGDWEVDLTIPRVSGRKCDA